MRPISRETIIDRRQPLMRWSAVFAGTALALGLWILFQTLGMGLGLAAVDIDDSGNLKGIGIGTGIWTVIAPLIAMFVGAFLAGRLAGTRDSRVGAMHGSVLWALATAVGLWAVLSLVGALASGVAHVGGAAASATGAVVSGAAKAGGKLGGKLDTGEAMSTLGIDTNDLVAPINEKLEAEGKPPISAEQINNAVRAVAKRGLHEGRVDRQVLVEELANNTSLSRADAEDIATRFGARYEEVANRIGQMGEKVKEGAKTAAQEAADKTGKALMAGGLMMLLSLGAAIGGGALGVRSSLRRERRDLERRDRDLERRDLDERGATIITPPAESTIVTRPADK